MSNPMSGLLLVLPLTLFLALEPHLIIATATDNNDTGAQGDVGGGGLIEKVCSGTQYKDLCVSILKAEPKSPKADMGGLAFIVLRAATKNATDTSTTIKRLLSDDIIEPDVDEGLRTCAQVYVDLVDQIQDSVNALVSRSFTDVETWVNVAIADVDTCQDSFNEITGSAVEISRRNAILREILNAGLGIVQVMARN